MLPDGSPPRSLGVIPADGRRSLHAPRIARCRAGARARARGQPGTGRRFADRRAAGTGPLHGRRANASTSRTGARSPPLQSKGPDALRRPAPAALVALRSAAWLVGGRQVRALALRRPFAGGDHFDLRRQDRDFGRREHQVLRIDVRLLRGRTQAASASDHGETECQGRRGHRGQAEGRMQPLRGGRRAETASGRKSWRPRLVADSLGWIHRRLRPDSRGPAGASDLLDAANRRFGFSCASRSKRAVRQS